MKKLIDILKSACCTAVSVLAIGAVTSCSDDLEVKTGIIGEKDGTITVYVPNVAGAAEYGRTRAEGNTATRDEEAKEGDINSLWIFAYPTSDHSSGNPVIEQLVNSKTEHKVSSKETDYTTYTVEGFKEGNYHIYIVANLEDYISVTLSTSLSENDLRKALLNFGTTSSKKMPVIGNLPMACLDNQVSSTPNGTGNTNGEFSVSKAGTTIYADLRFLCAKVRYTILFDRAGGIGDNQNFSKQFSSYNVDFNKTATATNIVPQIALTSAGILNNTDKISLNDLSLASVEYPSGETAAYLNIESVISSENAPANLKPVTSWDNVAQRAWQGVVYLPENNVQDSPSKLTFTPSGSGEIKADHCNFTLYWDKQGKTAHGLERSKMYDLVAKLTQPDVEELTLNCSVTDWTPLQLAYTLHGPYELIVETTKISVSSLEPGYLWYESDVAPEDIKFNFPRITYTPSGSNTSIARNFYTATVYKENGQYVLTEDGKYQIEVKINPSIPSTVLKKVNDEDGYSKEHYMYFEIMAGNLVKKIVVDPLTLDPFFRVTPNLINIDVRSYVGSGIKQETLDILVETNISDNISYTCDYISIVNNTSGALNLSAGEGTSSLTKSTSSTSSGTFKITDGVGHLNLILSKLFDGEDFWKTERTIYLKFSASADGYDGEDDLTIIIKPYTTDYIIHFKPMNGDWSDPHIYIYQCLEMPADLTMPEGTDNNYAGKTVGYGDKDTGNAALEYAFTNNIAFKGWKGYGGTVDPYGYDSSNKTSYDGSGFVKWGGSSHENDMNPSGPNENIYDYEVNMNSQHNTTNTECSICKTYTQTSYGHWNGYGHNANGGRKGAHLYAGVAMIKEDNGWYKYTLTGIATPGKAMIMFCDGHSSNDSKRYPAYNEVGVPLFDFPDHEGWFCFDGKTTRHDLDFIDDKENYKFKLYIPSSANGIYIWNWEAGIANIWDSSSSIAKTTDSNGKAIPTGYKVYEFTSAYASKSFNYKLRNTDSPDNRNGGTINNFELIDGVYVGYIENDGAAVKPGVPGNANPNPQSITVYWDNSNSLNWNQPYIHYYDSSGNGTSWPGVTMTKVRGNIWTYTITDVSKNTAIFDIGSSTHQTSGYTMLNNHVYRFNGDNSVPEDLGEYDDNQFQPGEKIEFNWNGSNTSYNHIYIYNPKIDISWPGAGIGTNGFSYDEWYKYIYTIPESCKTVTVIRNDGKGSNQGGVQEDAVSIEYTKIKNQTNEIGYWYNW